MQGRIIIRRTGQAIAVMFAVAALAAPVAQADPWQLERVSQVSENSPQPIPDAVDRYVASHPDAIPDAVDRYVSSHPDAISDAVHRHVANDRAHNTQPATDVADRFASTDHSDRIAGDFAFAASAPASEPGSGLDWDVLAVGFGLGIAACALVAVALLSLRRRRPLVHV